ncbi:MAG: chaperone modulator CbpM [Arenibacter sp.]|uniref:chaperone modulator CbpM n=1 Tax=Arenibacter lacus TaxID=2608629 RepID=UPI00123DF265|nr:chaperone modulator CbpM [Arenibacter lacus]MDX1328504.1 chaperone modulator CbpM [Arenibacter sp.]
MKQEEYIAIEDFCTSHNIASEFVIQLYDMGLIDMVFQENLQYLPLNQLPKAEKIVRLHLDLEINVQGLGVVTELLDRIQDMQNEITALHNKLSRYE